MPEWNEFNQLFYFQILLLTQCVKRTILSLKLNQLSRPYSHLLRARDDANGT